MERRIKEKVTKMIVWEEKTPKCQLYKSTWRGLPSSYSTWFQAPNHKQREKKSWEDLNRSV